MERHGYGCDQTRPLDANLVDNGTANDCAEETHCITQRLSEISKPRSRQSAAAQIRDSI